LKKNTKISLFIALGILVSNSCIPAFSLPNKPFQEVYPWLENHSFFPSSQLFGGGDSTVLYRGLTENRVVNFEVIYKDFDKIPDFKKAPVHTEELVFQSECPLKADEAPIVGRFFKYLQTGYNGLCSYSSEFAPVSKSNAQLIKLISLIYKSNEQVVINDLKAAKVTFEGNRYFSYSHENHYQKKLIKGGPVNYQFLSGKKYDYVLTPFGFLITTKSSKYLKELIDEVHADQKMYKNIKKETEEINERKEKEKPFDF